MKTITITLEDDATRACPAGTVVGTLAPDPSSGEGLPFLGALVNNDVSSMSYPLTVNSEVKFLTASDPHGWRIYRNSLCFLLAKTVREMFPEAIFSVEHSFGLGLYCSFSMADDVVEEGITAERLDQLDAGMRATVDMNVPIERRKVAYVDAIHTLSDDGQTEKLNLLRYRNPPRVVIHWCERFSDLAHGPLVPDTGMLDQFQLIPYGPGFVLHMPDRSDPTCIPPFKDQPHLFQVFREHKEWGRILGVSTVGRLNEIIDAGEIEDFIMTAEALHEKKVARIADQVAEQKHRVKLILIAGPSSAGKTTLSKRLSTQLRVNGVQPVSVSTDDYFVGKGKNPLDEDGRPDYEHIEAVDLDLFNEHLMKLIGGEAVELPRFDFAAKKRVPSGKTLRIGADQILIIEGIHGLNPRLTAMVPDERKFRLYVSALTQLSVDANNRISTTDNRLMRRIVRDHKYRGYSALDTLRRWPSVRRGEKRWIFPFQKEADLAFNSALDYELAVLKPLVEPLLMQVKPSDPEYAEARRLTEFLLSFLPIPAQPVP
ncbi:MAG: nucleoside kinase, partial [Lentisphaerae bacterium]|nr:nucleoside kinase [Lentisphaerota bacterium]